MSKTIHVGIIGAGAICKKRHIPGLQTIEDVEIVGVCNRSQESTQQVAQEFHIAKTYDHWYDLIYDPQIDAVVIGAWPYLHAPATLLALAHNKHVLCEARMAMNATEAHQMLHASQAKPHLVTQIVPAPFTLRLDGTLRRILAEGHIGTPLVIEVRDNNAFAEAKPLISWRQDIALSGYNMMTLGIWYECIMRWMGEAQSVMAMGQTFTKIKRDDQKLLKSVRLPDHLDVCAEMECGAQLHLQISTVTKLAGQSELYIFGEKGSLLIMDNRLYGGQNGVDHLQEIPVPPDLEGKWRVEEEFINAIRGLEPIKLTTLTDGVKYMEFTEAVFRSLQTGGRIPLPLNR